MAKKTPPEDPAVAEQQSAAAAAPAAEDVEKLRAELAAAKDAHLRCEAELDNFRKRSRRELDDQRRYAGLPLLRDLLPVLDNLDRAIQAAEKTSADKNADTGGLLAGVKLVFQQFEGVLERNHCRRIEALHTPFDPSLHQAILQQPSDAHPENTVIMVTQAGFQLHDRVVRPSQVIVSTLPPDSSACAAEPSEKPEG